MYFWSFRVGSCYEITHFSVCVVSSKKSELVPVEIIIIQGFGVGSELQNLDLVWIRHCINKCVLSCVMETKTKGDWDLKLWFAKINFSNIFLWRKENLCGRCCRQRLLPVLGREVGATTSSSGIRTGRSLLRGAGLFRPPLGPAWGSWSSVVRSAVVWPCGGLSYLWQDLTKSCAALFLAWKGAASVATLRAVKWPLRESRAINSWFHSLYCAVNGWFAFRATWLPQQQPSPTLQEMLLALTGCVPKLLLYRQRLRDSSYGVWAGVGSLHSSFFFSFSPPAVSFWMQPSHPALSCFWGFKVWTWHKNSGLEAGVGCWINPISAKICLALWGNWKRWRFTV